MHFIDFIKVFGLGIQFKKSVFSVLSICLFLKNVMGTTVLKTSSVHFWSLTCEPEMSLQSLNVLCADLSLLK